MDQNENMSLDGFKKLIASLTSTQNYHSEIDKIRSCLKLPLPNAKNKKHNQVEALLILMAKICYPDGDMKADIVLAALGLLKDFDNRNDNPEIEGINREKYLLTERYRKFLRESSYLEVVKVNNTLYHTYESLEQDAHSLDMALNTLGKKGKRHLEAVAEMLYENRAALEEYIAESENYIDEKNGKLILETLENQRTVPCRYQLLQGNRINPATEVTNGKIPQKKKKKKKGKIHAEILTAYGTIVNLKGKQTKEMMDLIKDISTRTVIGLFFIGIIGLSWEIFQHIYDYNALKNSQDINFTAEAPKNNTPKKGDKPEIWNPSPDNSYNEENNDPVGPVGDEENEEGFSSMSIQDVKSYSTITDNVTELVYVILGDVK